MSASQSDEYIYFESLEACRRVGYIVLLLSMLAGVPFAAFVVVINLGWFVLIGLAGARLVRKRALTPQFRGLFVRLRGFFRENWQSSLRTGTHAAGEIYIHNVLYLVVPLAVGLGAPTIVLDTALKIFWGTLNLCSAACEYPGTAADRGLCRARCTHASPRHFDRRRPVRHSGAGDFGAAAGRCQSLICAPARSCRSDAVRGRSDTARPAGHRRRQLAAGYFLLQHTGYFREIARLSIVNVLVMTTSVGVAFFAGFGVVRFLAAYAGAFVTVAVLYIIIAIRGPLRDAAR